MPYWSCVLAYVVDGITELGLTIDPIHGELFAADDLRIVVPGNGFARADGLEGVAADRAVAAGEEAQFRRQALEVVDTGVAERAAGDETAVVAEAADPFRVGGQLGEAGVGQEALLPGACGQGQRPAATREIGIVAALLRKRDFRIEQGGAALAVGHLEVAGEELQAECARPAMPHARIGRRQAQGLRLAGVGVLVAEGDAEVDAVVVGTRQRDLVQGRQGAQALGEDGLELQLVAAAVDPAPLDTAAHAGAGVGADEQSAGVDGALGRRQGDRDRHVAAGRAGGIRRHLSDGEIVGVDEALLQGEQVVLRVVVVDLPGDVALEEAIGELAALEMRVAEAVALAGAPRQLNLRGVLRAADLDAMDVQLGVEEAGAEQGGMDRRLAALVGGMVEPFVLARREGRTGAFDGADAGDLAVDAEVDGHHLHRRSDREIECGDVAAAFLAQLAGDGRVVVPVGLECALDLPFGTPVQAARLRRTDLATGVLADLEGGQGHRAQLAVDAVEFDADARGFGGRGPAEDEAGDDEAHAGADSEPGHCLCGCGLCGVIAAPALTEC